MMDIFISSHVLLFLLLVGYSITNVLTSRSCKDGEPTEPYEATVKNTTKLLGALRKLMKENGIQGYLVPSSDDHRTEYVAKWFKRREFISGFKGSQGNVVVTLDKAAVFVDGRYHDQVDIEVDCNWTPQKLGLKGALTVSAWVKKELKGKVIGVDPKVIGIDYKEDLDEIWGNEVTWKFIEKNLVDEIWKDRPKQSEKKIFHHPIKYTGENYQKKLDKLRSDMLKEDVSAIVVQALDDVAWLLNLRGHDVDFNPYFYGYIIVTKDTVSLYVDEIKVRNTSVKASLCGSDPKYCVSIKNYNYTIILKDLEDLEKKTSSQKIWLTPDTSVLLALKIPKKKQLIKASPIQLPKAQKNKVELEGMKLANIKDSIAIMEYFVWLAEQIKDGKKVTEITGSNKLTYFKSQQENFVSRSFGTIGGFGPNGAVIHYRMSKETNLEITDKSLYLLDSGCQFPEGSTDITRTIHLGTPTAKQKEMFTYVLKGSIGLASAVFPERTYGANIDVYARNALWKVGLDYRHGTGHGIGSFLSIHEGPGRINTGRTSQYETPLYEGMVFSDEPGYYEPDSYGIRLETAIYVTKAKTKYEMPETKFLKFDILTYLPFARNLIDIKYLNDRETDWLNEYNSNTRKVLTPYIKKQGKTKVLDFMMRETEPFEKDRVVNSAAHVKKHFYLITLVFTVFFNYIC